MKKRSTRWHTPVIVLSLMATFSTKGDAQVGHTLHLPIPGDLPTSESVPVTPPVSTDSLIDSPTSGLDDDAPVVHPRSAWHAPSQEMDRETHAPPNTRLSYQEVFTPAVTPFKRLQAYDMVDEMGRLTVRDPSLRPIEVAQAPTGASEEFAGEVTIETSRNWPTPIPSVAPDDFVVGYNTSDNSLVSFARDSAGNLFARGTTTATVRLTYKLAAWPWAFVAPMLPRRSVSDIATMVPADLRPITPSWLRASSDVVLQTLHISRADMFDNVLTQLVGYFRSFRDAELEQTSGADLYRDLALGRVGACRHRAYAMLLTLQSLGIPARYVGNEAHAWSEVYIQGHGWTRIDLGGWDVPLDAHTPSDREIFTPHGVDPFPQTGDYHAQYSNNPTLATSTTGSAPAPSDPAGRRLSGALPTDGLDGPRGGGNGGSGSGGGDHNGNGTGGMSGGGDHNGNGTGGMSGGGDHNGMGPGNGNGNGGGNSFTTNGPPDPRGGTADGSDPVSERGVTRLTLAGVHGDDTPEGRDPDGFVRGSMVRAEGEVHDTHGQPVSGLLIEVLLVAPASGTQKSLGSAVSQADGHWRARMVLEPELSPGAYVIRATTQGDAHHAGATAE